MNFPAALLLAQATLVALVTRDAGPSVAASIDAAVTVSELRNAREWLMGDCGLDANDTFVAILDFSREVSALHLAEIAAAHGPTAEDLAAMERDLSTDEGFSVWCEERRTAAMEEQLADATPAATVAA